MFIDRAQISVKAGKGGDGAISFLRLKFMEYGGPDGGGGGRGASIYFQASRSETTLYKFRYQRKIIALDGDDGQSTDRYGKSAEDLVILVPIGTVVYDDETQQIIADLSEDGEKALIVKGGRGGRGNATFKSSVNRAPRIAEKGAPGEARKITIELKLLADVGIVGFPSVGKSSLLSVVSNAKPEIADYEFTTLVPQLGVVQRPEKPPFTIADLPGLIEDAHKGKGLGLNFLRHIERCRVILHVVDMASHRDPVYAYQSILKELQAYAEDLLDKPTLIVASKMDEPSAEENLKKLKTFLKRKKIYPISVLSNEGIPELLDAIEIELSKHPVTKKKVQESTEEKIYTYQTPSKFKITKRSPHVFVIQGEEVETTYQKFNLSTDQGIMSLLQYLRKIKVEDALETMGIQEGDTVVIGEFEFTYYA
ncbi:MAG: GTPase ObgE [Bacilli bacterium]